MKKFIIVLVSIVAGFLASLVFILGASPFEVQGQNSSMQETLGGCAAVFLFSTACQFWLTRMGGSGFVTGLLVMVGMVGALLTHVPSLCRGEFPTTGRCLFPAASEVLREYCCPFAEPG